MTSPNRETEAQQVEARVEQIILTKVKASLRVKTGTIKENPEQGKTTTDRELQKMVTISKADHQEMVREAALNREAEERETIKTLKAGLREMEKEAALNQEKAEILKAASDQKAREAQEDLPASNHAHSKKAVPKRCQEMKAAVM